jgi:metal-responsive CopG/Arc/MetJ family transcriptional regulator
VARRTRRAELEDRAASRRREVRVTFRLTLDQVLWLDMWARRSGMSRSEAIRDALWVRSYNWQFKWELRHRARMRELIRRAEEWAPVDELLAEAREVGECEALAARIDVDRLRAG